MGDGIIVRRGGGGAELGYRVIQIASAANLPATSSSKENDIAIITTTAITRSTISLDTPPSPIAGEISIPAKITAPDYQFDALKDNKNRVITRISGNITQYVGGVWVTRVGYIFRSGAWIDFTVWYYQLGNSYSAITGGFGFLATGYTSNGLGVSCTILPSSIRLDIPTWDSVNIRTGLLYTIKKVDITSIGKLYVAYTGRAQKGAGAATVYLQVTAQNTSDTPYLARAATITHTRDSSAAVEFTGELSVDIAGISGSYHVMVVLTRADGTTGLYVDISKIWGEF